MVGNTNLCKYCYRGRFSIKLIYINWMIISLLGASLIIQAQCLKIISLSVDHLRKANSKNKYYQLNKYMSHTWLDLQASIISHILH
jgi:hypothetical protein